MKLCTVCNISKPFTEFYDAARSQCKSCAKIRSKNRYDTNIVNIKLVNAEFYQKNSAAIKAKSAARRALLPGVDRESKRRWKDRNAAALRAAKLHRNAQEMRAVPSWANKFFIEQIYELARLRSKVTSIKWHVDHIVPLISKHVCGLHVEHNLAVIPASVNMKKNNLWWPDMADVAAIVEELEAA